MMQQRVIAVIGGNAPDAASARLAEAVGREIAKRGAALVCGGLGGVMEAACRGANEAGGLTVGILPGTDRSAANPYVKVPIVSGIGYARNAIVAGSAQAVIAVDGSYGTLSEISFALQAGTPVIGLGTWEISIDGKADQNIIRAKTADEAVTLAFDAINQQQEH